MSTTSYPALLQQRARCRRILDDHQLCAALPDKGDRVRLQLEAAELGLAKLALEDPTLSVGNDDQKKESVNSVTPIPPEHSGGPTNQNPRSSTSSSPTAPSSSAGVDSATATAIGEQIGAVRPDVYEELRKVFRGQLSDREIRRLAAEADNSFLSFKETQALEREQQEVERQRLLAQLFDACHDSGAGNPFKKG